MAEELTPEEQVAIDKLSEAVANEPAQGRSKEKIDSRRKVVLHVT